VKALPEIVKKDPDFRLVIISPRDKKFEQLIAPGFHNYITWIDWVTQEELRDRI